MLGEQSLASGSVQSHYGVLVDTAGGVLVTSTCWHSTGGGDKDYTEKPLVLIKGQDRFRMLRSWKGILGTSMIIQQGHLSLRPQ